MYGISCGLRCEGAGGSTRYDRRSRRRQSFFPRASEKPVYGKCCWFWQLRGKVFTLLRVVKVVVLRSLRLGRKRQVDPEEAKWLSECTARRTRTGGKLYGKCGWFWQLRGKSPYVCLWRGNSRGLSFLSRNKKLNEMKLMARVRNKPVEDSHFLKF